MICFDGTAKDCTPCGAIFVIYPVYTKWRHKDQKLKQGNTYMSHSNKTTNYTEFYYHLFKNVLIITVSLLVIISLALSLPHSSATVSSSSDLSSSADHLDFAIPVSCTLVSNVEETHSATLFNGTYKDNIG